MTRRTRKRAAILIAATAVTAAGGAGAYAVREAQQERLAQRARIEGLAALEARDHAAALEHLVQFVARRRDDREVLMALAEARRNVPMENNRHLVRAADYARAASELAPHDPAPVELLVELYAQAGFARECLDAADRLLALEPLHGAAFRARLEALGALGRTDEALAAATARARAIPDDPDAHRAVLELMQRTGASPEVLLAYARELQAAAPDTVDFSLLKYDAARLAGDEEAATAAARRAALLHDAIGPDLGAVLRALDWIGLPAEGDALLARALADPAAARGAAAAGAARAWKAGDLTEADRLARLSVAEPGAADDEALGWALLISLDEEPAAAKAEALARELERRATPAGRAWVAAFRARSTLLEGNARRAIAILRSVPADERPAAAAYILGQAHLALGDWRRAVEFWSEDLIRRDPTWRVARLQLVRLLLDHSRPREAHAHARAGFVLRPALPEAMAVAETSLTLLETFRDAPVEPASVVALLESVLAEHPDHATALAHLARAQAAAGDRDAGASTARRLLDSPSPRPADLIALAAVHRAGDPALAAELTARACRAAPDDPHILLTGALAMERAGDAAGGERLLRDAAKTDGPARTAMQVALARYRDHIGDPGAGRMLTTLAAAHPDLPEAQVALLDSRAGWRDREAILAAIGRLRDILGPTATLPAHYEARELLVFEPSPARAARAAALLGRVIRSDPGDAAAHLLAADAWLALGDRDQAIEALSAAVSADPSAAALHLRLVDLLVSAGRAPEARRRLADFARITEVPARIRRERAEALALHGMLDDAIREYEQLAASGAGESRLELAVLHARAGNADRARTLFDALLAQPEPDARAIAAAAEFFAEEREVDRARGLLDRLPAALAPAERLALRARVFEALGLRDDAEREHRDWLATGAPEAAAAAASFYLRQGRPADAAAVLDAALLAQPADPLLLNLRAACRALAPEGADPDAIHDLVAALESGGPGAKRLAAAIARLAEDPPDAAACVLDLQALTRDDPAFFPAWPVLIAVLSETGRADEAAEAAVGSIRALPNDPRIAESACRALQRLGRLDDAADAARAWRDLSPRSPAPEIALARIEAMRGRAGEAAALLRPHRDTIVAQADRDPDSLELLARLTAETGNPEDAHQLLWSRAAADPAWVGAYVRAGAAAAMGPAAKREWLNRSDRLQDADPESRVALAQAWFDLGLVTGEQGDLSRAAALAEELADEPTLAGRGAALAAMARERLGDPDAAERLYRRALAARPDEPVWLNNLAFILLQRGEPSTEPVEYASRAAAQLDRGPERLRVVLLPAVLDTLGLAHSALGDHPAAAAAFRRGLDLDPAHPALLLGLCESLLMQGRPDEARAALLELDQLGRSILEASTLGPRYRAAHQAIGAGGGVPDQPVR